MNNNNFDPYSFFLSPQEKLNYESRGIYGNYQQALFPIPSHPPKSAFGNHKKNQSKFPKNSNGISTRQRNNKPITHTQLKIKQAKQQSKKILKAKKINNY
jgi:hypothetical protein